jgi:hypothetical protein
MGSVPAARPQADEVFKSGAGFDRVIVQVDSRLHYDDLMQIIDICTRQNLPSGRSAPASSVSSSYQWVRAKGVRPFERLTEFELPRPDRRAAAS